MSATDGINFQSTDEILDYAIKREQGAHDFYLDLANKVDRPGMKELFVQYAKEELGHRKKLEGVKEGKTLEPSKKKIMDLKIADYTVEVDPNEDLDFQKALLLAMQREKSSFKLYIDIANATTDQNLKLTFMALAQEEAKHKLRFEVEYDDIILAEN